MHDARLPVHRCLDFAMGESGSRISDAEKKTLPMIYAKLMLLKMKGRKVIVSDLEPETFYATRDSSKNSLGTKK